MEKYKLVIEDVLNAYILDTVNRKIVCICNTKRPDLTFNRLKELINYANKGYKNENRFKEDKKNFNFEEFKKRYIAVHCSTEEKAKDFIKQCIKYEIKQWENEELLNVNNIEWDDYGRNTCYSYINFYNFGGEGLEYGNIDYYKEDNYEIVEW